MKQNLRTPKAVPANAQSELTVKLLHEAHIHEVPGFQAAGVYAGLKRRRRDVTVLYSTRPATCAGVTTQNLVVAAPVLLTRQHLARGTARAIVCNSGCANACTGEQGLQDARRMAELAAQGLGLEPEDVLVASTGVIGQLLPMAKVENGIREAVALLPAAEPGAAAEGIMTTDTVAKEIVVEATYRGRKFRVGGIAKGSGMIMPNMATMLAFLVTDAAVPAPALQAALTASANRSFNCVSVDHDTSTNDMALVLANGASGLTWGVDLPAEVFQAALDKVTTHLAKSIARDGEGATKLFEVQVAGATSDAEAKRAAMAVVNSPLVKSAVHGEDPNWGRILAAVGRSGAQVRLDLVSVHLGNPSTQVQVLSRGEPVDFDRAAAHQLLTSKDVLVRVELGLGSGVSTVWGCDLSREYVDINAHYTT